MDALPEILTGVLATSVFSVFTFLIRSYFQTIHKEIERVKSDINKFNGRLEYLYQEQKEIAEKLILNAAETKAVWRILDKNRRISDE